MLTKELITIDKSRLREFLLRLERILPVTAPYSYEEYLCYALRLALTSLEEENYGIGAVIVFRTEGTEYVIGGRSQVFSRKDSRLHAERDALQKFEALAQSADIFQHRMAVGDISPSDIMLTRKAPDLATHAFLVTTLETCAACYQEILVHNTFGVKIAEICTGADHANSGNGHYLRSEMLPPLWRQMAEEQNISIFTLWHSQLYELSLDIFNALPRLHKKYLGKNAQEIGDTIINIERLLGNGDKSQQNRHTASSIGKN